MRFRSPHDALRGRRRDDLPGPRARPAPGDLAERLHRRRAHALAAFVRLLDKARMRARCARATWRASAITHRRHRLGRSRRSRAASARRSRSRARCAGTPSSIIMDEPTAALGVEGDRQVLDLDPRAQGRRHDRHPGQPQHGRGGRGRDAASRSSRAAARWSTARSRGSMPMRWRTW